MESDLLHSKLAAFSVNDLAYELKTNGFLNAEYSEQIQAWVKDGGELVKETFRLMTQCDLANPMDAGQCAWHLHERSQLCAGD